MHGATAITGVDEEDDVHDEKSDGEEGVYDGCEERVGELF